MLPFLSYARFGWNADRIWVSTPQNRTYRAWVDSVRLMEYKLLEMVLVNGLFLFFHTYWILDYKHIEEIPKQINPMGLKKVCRTFSINILKKHPSK